MKGKRSTRGFGFDSLQQNLNVILLKHVLEWLQIKDPVSVANFARDRDLCDDELVIKFRLRIEAEI